MASAGPNRNGSEFYLQLADFPLESLDERHTVFGEISEGLEALERLNEAAVDPEGRPIQNIRIRHTIILDDPFDDPSGEIRALPFTCYGCWPVPSSERSDPDCLPQASSLSSPRAARSRWSTRMTGSRRTGGRRRTRGRRRRSTRRQEQAAWTVYSLLVPIRAPASPMQLKRKEAENKAVVLEMIGDLPDADVKPPSNMLFICKLNPVTTEEDLELIFSQAGPPPLLVKRAGGFGLNPPHHVYMPVLTTRPCCCSAARSPRATSFATGRRASL